MAELPYPVKSVVMMLIGKLFMMNGQMAMALKGAYSRETIQQI